MNPANYFPQFLRSSLTHGSTWGWVQG